MDSEEKKRKQKRQKRRIIYHKMADAAEEGVSPEYVFPMDEIDRELPNLEDKKAEIKSDILEHPELYTEGRVIKRFDGHGHRIYIDLKIGQFISRKGLMGFVFE